MNKEQNEKKIDTILSNWAFALAMAFVIIMSMFYLFLDIITYSVHDITLIIIKNSIIIFLLTSLLYYIGAVARLTNKIEKLEE